MQVNRVLAMLGLAVAAGIALVWFEGHNLRLKQKVSELYYLQEQLTEEQARLRLAVSRLAAPARVIESVQSSESPLEEPRFPVASEPRGGIPLYLPR